MDDRFATARREIEDRALRGPGDTDPARRTAIADGESDRSPALTAYLEKVRRHAYRVTDEEVLALLAAGHTEDEIFEITLSAAIGAARSRFQAARSAFAGGKTT